jgi:hypothetical protein
MGKLNMESTQIYMLHDSANCKHEEIIAEHNILVVFADFCNQTVQYAI